MAGKSEAWSDPEMGLVRRWLVDRDEAAARELMGLLYPRIAGIVAGHLPRGMDREDLIQEVFLRVFRGLDRFRPVRPMEHWVSRIALNVCRSRGSARARRPEWHRSDLSEGEQAAFDAALAAEETGPKATVDANDARALMRRFMEGLAPVDRQILTLLHLEGRSVGEIASLMGMGRTAVRVRAFRARGRLREVMKALEKGL